VMCPRSASCRSCYATRSPNSQPLAVPPYGVVTGLPRYTTRSPNSEQQRGPVRLAHLRAGGEVKYRLVGVGSALVVMGCFAGGLAFWPPLWVTSYFMTIPIWMALVRMHRDRCNSWEYVGRLMLQSVRRERIPRAIRVKREVKVELSL